ncbi:uncharacterized protein M6B38_361965 [Iris pallida]|uniref:C2 domain-containing protein n=1 Tax=Iris pallida TaxID=29817 RepID=A0AAX6GJJ6_IRIPA|nr:uncharacterized protein M6B38_361965 [Iris pallida]
MDNEQLFLEISLISAQDLKKPPSPSSALRRGGGLHAYASVSLPGFPKLRTRVDRVGVSNPTWNDRFVFLLPSPLLLPDSPSALSVDILSRAPSWLLPDSPLGSTRILLANLRLLDRPRDVPTFSAFGIRRPSGSFRGVLNVGFTLLSRVSARTADALARGGANAVGYRDLMGRECQHQPHPPRVLKEINHCTPTTTTTTDFLKKDEEEVAAEEEEEGTQLCGFGGMKRRTIQVSPSAENLQLSWSNSDHRNSNNSGKN